MTDHIRDLKESLKDARLAEALEEGYRAGGSRARRAMSDEPDVPEAPNPYATSASA